MKPSEGRRRVVIEEVQPVVSAGRYPACRIIGDQVTVSAAVFADGHDHIGARILYKHSSERAWRTSAMRPEGNDVWSGSFSPGKIGSWKFQVQGWIDHFDTWNSDLKKRLAAQPSSSAKDVYHQDQNIPLALRSGALLLEEAADRARGKDAKTLRETHAALLWLASQDFYHFDNPVSEEVVEIARRYPDLSFAVVTAQEYSLWVDRERARFSTWYELFPRSTSPIAGKHGTLRDVEAQLPEIAGMGFDVLYFPPIHPIGSAFRKGPNNNTVCQPGDHGSPWAIGAATGDNEGGHKSIHSELGTLDDFDHLLSVAANHNIEIALDIAFQCSPDHPWVKQHPTWFTIRPDGSIQYAENPPKKYQDIYPLNFESEDWRGLWQELYSVFEFWIQCGVAIFRVDNPHTKALPFWEWCIGALREKYPTTIFLAEAFTRPHVMYSLAKAGFTQSYTYFTWRTSKAELQTYLEEITRPPISNFFKPNFWPNTPDILHKSLQVGGRNAFMQRVILAATLTSNYGIYGPAYELGENIPATPSPGRSESEEYMDSEKYELRQRSRNQEHSLVGLITDLNNIRRANIALQSNDSLWFHAVDNPNIMCYSKSYRDVSGIDNTILVAINLDASQEQAGWIDLDLKQLRIPNASTFVVHDLLNGSAYRWNDRSNYVALRPDVQPAHIFRLTLTEPVPA